MGAPPSRDELEALLGHDRTLVDVVLSRRRSPTWSRASSPTSGCARAHGPGLHRHLGRPPGRRDRRGPPHAQHGEPGGDGGGLGLRRGRHGTGGVRPGRCRPGGRRRARHRRPGGRHPPGRGGQAGGRRARRRRRGGLQRRPEAHPRPARRRRAGPATGPGSSVVGREPGDQAELRALPTPHLLGRRRGRRAAPGHGHHQPGDRRGAGVLRRHPGGPARTGASCTSTPPTTPRSPRRASTP